MIRDIKKIKALFAAKQAKANIILKLSNMRHTVKLKHLQIPLSKKI